MTQILICLSLARRASFINALYKLEFVKGGFFWKRFINRCRKLLILARAKTGNLPKREFKSQNWKNRQKGI